MFFSAANQHMLSSRQRFECDMGTIKQKFKRAAFSNWLQTGLGQRLLRSEQETVADLLPNLFGYNIVQLGSLAGNSLVDSSRIGNRIIYRLADEDAECSDPDLIGSEESLPFPDNSIDVVVAPHLLEFSSTPHKILREIDRILIGDGYLLIIGFNPYSLWGLWKIFLAWRDNAPWNGHFYSAFRLKDWLTLLEFEVEHVEKISYRPPLQKERIVQRLHFLEKLGKYCWPYFGGVYMILAQKRVMPMTPIKMRWQKKRQMISSGVVEPTTRS